MILFDVEQGSEEWHNARAGVITASRFVEVRKRLKTGPNKGKHTEAAQKYARRLAIERLTGNRLEDFTFVTRAMERGQKLEEAARLRHEKEIGEFIEQVGFMVTDDGRFGASADGLIGEDGGSEYKCLIDPDRIDGPLMNGDISEFTDQIQGNMWISGRRHWEFVMYVPALAPLGLEYIHQVVPRDESYIEELVEDLEAFDALVVEQMEALTLRAEKAKMAVESNSSDAEGIF